MQSWYRATTPNLALKSGFCRELGEEALSLLPLQAAQEKGRRVETAAKDANLIPQGLDLEDVWVERDGETHSSVVPR